MRTDGADPVIWVCSFFWPFPKTIYFFFNKSAFPLQSSGKNANMLLCLLKIPGEICQVSICLSESFIHHLFFCEKILK